jgi:hypothetical protein
LTLRDVFDPSQWPGLTVICWIKLPLYAPGVKGVLLMNKGRFIPELQEFTNGMVPTYANPDRPDELVPVMLPGLVLSKLLTGETPDIVRAELMEPAGRRLQLKPVEMPGGVPFDPNDPGADFFKFLVEYTEGLKRSTTLAKEDLADGGKCIGNSGAYGIWAETNVEDLRVGEREPVRLYIDEEGQEARLLNPEDPGKFFCIAIASLITSAARLMLGLAHCARRAIFRARMAGVRSASSSTNLSARAAPCSPRSKLRTAGSSRSKDSSWRAAVVFSCRSNSAGNADKTITTHCVTTATSPAASDRRRQRGRRS